MDSVATPILPGDTVMIGDSDVDVLTARNCGAWAIGCTFGLAPHSLAAARPDGLSDTPADWPQTLRAIAGSAMAG